MTKAIRRRNENIDKLLKRFEKAVKKADISRDARRHEVFSSKAEKSRQKSREAAWKANSSGER